MLIKLNSLKQISTVLVFGLKYLGREIKSNARGSADTVL